MLCFTAFVIIFIQCLTCVSASFLSIYGLVLMDVMLCSISSWKLSQLAFLKLGVGLTGIRIARDVIVSIIGRWSEEVVGPGAILTLWYVLLFPNMMSGEVEALCEWNVGKLGPM